MDDIILTVPDEFIDITECTLTPKTCETSFPGDFTLTGGPTDWGLGTFVDNCHCSTSTTVATDYDVVQECVDISEDGDPENLVCIVTVIVALNEQLDCPHLSSAASSSWTYKVLGPIDISTGDFEVPFFSQSHTTPPVCEPDNFPDMLIIKETP